MSSTEDSPGNQNNPLNSHGDTRKSQKRAPLCFFLVSLWFLWSRNQLSKLTASLFLLVVQVGFPCLGKQDGVAAFEVNVIVMNSEGNTILQTPQNAIFFKTCQQGEH